MIDHQAGEFPAINQHNTRLYLCGIIGSVPAKVGRRDEDTLLGSKPLQGTGKLLNLRTADRILLTFRL